MINGMAVLGNSDLFKRTIRPEFFGFVSAGLPIFIKGLGGGDLFTLGIYFLDLGHAFIIRPGCSGFDPIADDPGFLLGKFVDLLGRHLVVFHGPGCDKIELAF